jgi:TetR/AcrR family transcriptional repressor of mexJK operon
MKRAKIPAKPPDWLARLPDPRDEEILSAAFDVFSEQGFHGATMQAIAARARASKKTLYERFADKADLFRALLAWGCRQNLPEEPPPDDGDAEDALLAHARTVMAAMMRPESLALFRIVAAEAQRFPEIGALFDRMTREPSARIVSELARRLTRAGRIGRVSGEAFGADFIGLLRGDLFFRAAIGVVPVPGARALDAHAERAMKRLLRAHAP